LVDGVRVRLVDVVLAVVVLVDELGHRVPGRVPQLVHRVRVVPAVVAWLPAVVRGLPVVVVWLPEVGGEFGARPAVGVASPRVLVVVSVAVSRTAFTASAGGLAHRVVGVRLALVDGRPRPRRPRARRGPGRRPRRLRRAPRTAHRAASTS
jgi:hypothetical protein